MTGLAFAHTSANILKNFCGSVGIFLLYQSLAGNISVGSSAFFLLLIAVLMQLFLPER